MKPIPYFVMLLVVVVVACIDEFFLVKYGTVINELNPVGLWLINTGGVEFFAACKMFGTCIVVGWFTWGYHFNKKISTVCLAVTMLAMLSLLLFLFLA